MGAEMADDKSLQKAHHHWGGLVYGRIVICVTRPTHFSLGRGILEKNSIVPGETVDKLPGVTIFWIMAIIQIAWFTFNHVFAERWTP